MDPTDPRLPFICRCLAQALETNGLPLEQNNACVQILNSVYADYNSRSLACQNADAFGNPNPPSNGLVN